MTTPTQQLTWGTGDGWQSYGADTDWGTNGQIDMVQAAAQQQAQDIGTAGTGMTQLNQSNIEQGTNNQIQDTGILAQNTFNSKTTDPWASNAASAAASYAAPGGLDSSGAMGGLGTAGAIAGGVGTVVGAYDNASTDTGSSVLSGAASGAVTGAEIGSIVPGIGTAFGAVAGAVIGGIAGFFGSKSKKNQEKKAFQQQEQFAVLPQQQQEANYLQNQGLLQKAMSNYGSGYQPGGYQYKNKLFGNGGKAPSYAQPSSTPSLPNFNVSPTNVVPGSGDKSLGIAPQSTANNGVNLNPTYGQAPQNAVGIGATGLVAPTSTIQQPQQINAQAPGYTGNKAQDQSNLSSYQQQYVAMLNQQNQEQAAQAMNPYSAFYGA